MKRDMDIIRTLLLRLEAWPLKGQSIALIGPHDERLIIDNVTTDQIAYHLRLIREQDLVDSPGSQPLSGSMTFRGLTWQGHDFLDSVRDDEVWRKTKKGAEAAGGFTVDLLLGLAKAIITAKVKELTGLHL